MKIFFTKFQKDVLMTIEEYKKLILACKNELFDMLDFSERLLILIIQLDLS